MSERDEKQRIKLTVFRFNPEADKEPKYETYEAEWVPSLTAHMALTYINRHTRANIAFRRGCREAGCGACTIMVNGVPELACRVIVNDGDVLEALRGYPVIRDLVIERTPQTTEMFRKIKYGREGKPIGFVPAKPEEMNVSRALTICADCHGCNTICPPWLETPHAFIGPMYMVNIIRAMFNPLEEYDRVTQAVEMGLYNCTMCRACTVSCPKDIEIAESVIRARERAVKADFVPGEVKKIHRNIMEADNLYGGKKDKLISWAAPLGIPKSGRTLFFSSCEYSATEDGRRILALIAGLLQKAGVSLSYLYDEEPCCGGPLYFYGFQDEFKEKVAKTQKILKEKGIEEIITPGPLCAYTFKELYPKYGGNSSIRTRTALEVILEKVKSKEIFPKSVGSKKVVFHDPPFLSRFLNIINEPREILRSIPGVSLLEPKYYWGANTFGDGNMVVSEEVSSNIAKGRLRQLVGCGADTIVTASASDLSKLKRATKSLGKKDIEIMDIIEFVARSLEV
jgi:fumarate reductase (CoM/CoB) subunit B